MHQANQITGHRPVATADVAQVALLTTGAAVGNDSSERCKPLSTEQDTGGQGGDTPETGSCQRLAANRLLDASLPAKLRFG